MLSWASHCGWPLPALCRYSLINGQHLYYWTFGYKTLKMSPKLLLKKKKLNKAVWSCTPGADECASLHCNLLFLTQRRSQVYLYYRYVHNATIILTLTPKSSPRNNVASTDTALMHWPYNVVASRPRLTQNSYNSSLNFSLNKNINKLIC